MYRQLPAPEIQFVDIGVGTPVITQRSVPGQSRRSPFRNIKSPTLSSMQTQAFHKVKTQEVPLVHIVDEVIDVLAATHGQISMNTARESTDGVVNIFVETQVRTLMVQQVMKNHHFTEVRVERPQLQTVENIVKIFEIQGSSHEVEG